MKRKSLDIRIMQSIQIHGNKYDYSKNLSIKTSKDKAKIICPKHGMFRQRWTNHINSKQGCPKCHIGGKYSKQFFELYPEKKSLPAILYLIKLTSLDEIFYKVGITTRSIEKRWAGKQNYEMELIMAIHANLFTLFNIEQNILKEYVYRNRHIPKHKIGGAKECFKSTILDDVKHLMLKIHP